MNGLGDLLREDYKGDSVYPIIAVLKLSNVVNSEPQYYC